MSDSCNTHGPIPCRVFVTYDTGDNIDAEHCHNFCWSAQGDDGRWCIKSSTRQCTCFYSNDCGCPASSSVEDDCTNPARKNSEAFQQNSSAPPSDITNHNKDAADDNQNGMGEAGTKVVMQADIIA